MLLYDAHSPAPRCLRMFILEKHLTIPSITIDVFAGENRGEPFLSLNPAGQTPALQLDDGRVLAEAVAIAEYLEEENPQIALIGTTAIERTETRQWWRRVELNITEFIHNAYHYAEGLERFKDRIPVAPEAADGLKRVARDRTAWLDSIFGNGPYLCGQRFTAADIWLYVWLDFADSVGQPFDHALPHLGPWFNLVSTRPSAERSRQLLADA
ncbi:glutathione S-transferase [Acidithiobacillus thiooxidans]|uniref:Glutathione S-transferase n=2 Tax=Acidithiobacillus thiooxidans TaxID=930 RepID=A0A1C2IER2_ACITH|nr:glutathione S-transferase family protein [Acidithiobacillus thiooxidans]OCX68096.1 glutathione S-transferase [Acidithiobacillus thiooxidans]OCX74470.1 glutathione S-transferase [Acidithiobacillus thiooxidans]OCX76745.1 glutathione S-transferase [Acidithiobacillus thiooxidans]OCX78625.1 glutathione S-transferase [Acidithiobacillus thiooxidans]OCX84943.1 glutathione S-transferase [Acidithiobacillus thiooxidans]